MQPLIERQLKKLVQDSRAQRELPTWVRHPHISVTLIRIFECLEKTTRGNRIELRTADPCLSSVVECITCPCQPLLLCYFPIIPQTTDPILNSSTRVL